MDAAERTVRLDAIEAVVQFLRDTPEVPLPWAWIGGRIALTIFADDLAEFQRLHELIGGQTTKPKGNDGYDYHYRLKHSRFAPVILYLGVDRELICKRVERTRIIPAQPAQPEREETYYEWDCPGSILKP